MTQLAREPRPVTRSAVTRRSITDKFAWLVKVLYAIAVIIYAYLLYSGTSFYFSPYMERPHHADYRQLRPAGITGHTYGVIGSTLMILMLSYSLRKRAKFLRNKGRLSHWLDIHIFFGIMGPLLIVLHTSFKVQGLVAVSFWSMVAVALSGIFGRYLYLQIPRNIQGEELSLKDLEDENSQYNRRLKDEYKLSDNIIMDLEKRYTPSISDDDSTVKVLFTIVAEDMFRPFRRGRGIEISELENVPREVRHDVIRVFERKALMNRKIMLLDRVQQLFHYWHVIHKPFAIVMYVIMLIHVTVAIWTGYKWIF